MNILYYGFDGPAASLILGWIFLLGAGLFFTFSFIELHEKRFVASIVFGFASLFLIYSTIYAFSDNRVPIVKATVDNNISYVEMNSHYELMKQEGKLYTFKVLGTSNEEWEAVVEEQNK